ncbi:MAG: MFS transporter [Chloroflexota bacterium]
MTTDLNKSSPKKQQNANQTMAAPSSPAGRLLRFVSELTGGRSLPSLRWQEALAAFKHRNYRLWFAGQLISLVGTWMQATALGYLVFELTHSPVYLGYVGFASGVPAWLFMLYGGVVADRMSRRTLLVLTQTVMMILAFILAALTFTGLIQPWHIVLLSLGLGVANAFDAPARQSFVVEMVGLEDLANAIALNSSMFNLATTTGPAVAGITYAVVGPAWCFTINGLTFIAVIIALLWMQLSPPPARLRSTAVLDDLKEGLRYVASNTVIRTLIGTAAVMSFIGMAYVTLMPAWAVKILGGDAVTNGWLQSARGLGAFLGAAMIASLGRFNFKGKLLTLGTFTFPCLLLIFAQVRWLPLSLLALVGIGWGFMIVFNMANTLLQTVVSNELRGRVVSVYTLNFFGFMPLGALLAGALAASFGEPMMVRLSALILLGFAVFLWLWVPRLRALK